MVLNPAPVGITPGVQVTPSRDVPQCAVILLARGAYMSGIGATLDFGLPQPLAIPLAIAFVRLPSWPLQSIAVLDRIEQPERFTIGAPLSDKDTWDVGCP